MKTTNFFLKASSIALLCLASQIFAGCPDHPEHDDFTDVTMKASELNGSWVCEEYLEVDNYVALSSTFNDVQYDINGQEKQRASGKYSLYEKTGRMDLIYSSPTSMNGYTSTFAFTEKNLPNSFTMKTTATNISVKMCRLIKDNVVVKVGETLSLGYQGITSCMPTVVSTSGSSIRGLKEGTALIRVPVDSYGNPSAYGTEYNYVRVYVDGAQAQGLPDYTSLFKKTKNQVRSAMSQYNLSDETTSQLLYIVNDNGLTTHALFWFDGKGSVMDYYRLFLNSSVDESEIRSLLAQNYTYGGQYTSESGDIYYAYVNALSKIGVAYMPGKRQVDVWDLTQVEEQSEVKALWQDYQNYLGKTTTQIRSAFGSPLSDDNNMLFYRGTEENVNYFAFSYNSSSTCHTASVLYNDNLTESDVKTFLDSRFYFSESVSTSEQYVYYDAQSASNVTMVVMFSPSDKIVMYSSRNISRNLPDVKAMKNIIAKTAKRFPARKSPYQKVKFPTSVFKQ